jgi:C1A family cysteine protease
MQYLERKGAADLLYSRLYLYYYGRAAEGTPPGEDSGMFIRTAMKVLKARGVCTDATWNYDNAEMRFTQKPPTAADLEAAQHKALSYYRCVDLYTIKSSLIHGYPVVFGFSVPENMESPQCAVSGMVLYPGSSESIIGGHAVLAVGYDDSIVIGSSIGAVLCQNSWGTSWGLSGFFYLPYRFFYDGLASDCWTIRKAQV